MYIFIAFLLYRTKTKLKSTEMSYLKPMECVNPTYQESEDGDSYHYIEPMDWTNEQPPNSYDTASNHNQPEHEMERSRSLRHRGKANIRDELPSRNFDSESEPGDATVKRHNSNLGGLRLRAAVIRQMDSNALFDVLNTMNCDPNATSEDLRETLRSVNQSLTMKRAVKKKLNKEGSKQDQKNVSWAKQIKYSFAMNWQHLKQEIWTLSQSVDLWHSHLKAVQGHFGSGVASYFFFLRRLFFLNLLACVLIVSFVVIPQAIWDSNQPPQKTIPFVGYELITGDGSFPDTVLYYGHYTNSSLPEYKMPEAYFFTYTAYIFCCLLVLTYSVAKTYRLNYIESAGELKNVFAPKLLCSWDYTIERESSARLKSTSICNELRELIVSQRNSSNPQKLSTRFFIYLWRILVNLLILAGMAATGYLVSWLLQNKKDYISAVEIPVLKEITVALVVTGILFVVPFLFSLMSNWENYSSKQTQLYLNIIRVVMLRAVILGVVVAFWLYEASKQNIQATSSSQVQSTTDATEGSTTASNPDPIINIDHGNVDCWETRLGQEIYRLIIVDFICILLLPTFIMEFLRWILYKNGWEWVGYPEFDIAQNTLDLVYTQMLVWVGFFYSPLLPFIALSKLVIIFYVKRLSVVRNCRTPRRAWRAAHAQTLFLTLTFFCFMFSLFALGYTVFTIQPSRNCGPFRDSLTVFNTMLTLLTASKKPAEVWEMLVSPGVVAGVLLFLCVVVYYKRATAKAHMDMVKLLREQLTQEGKDKVFLLRLFESAMEQQEICSYMKRNVQVANNAISRETSESPKFKHNNASNMTRAVINNPNIRPGGNSSNENPVENEGNQEEWTRKDRLGELQLQEKHGSQSSSRESSPFRFRPFPQEAGTDGHRLSARDSPPYSKSQHSNSPMRYGYSDSPRGSMDRRGSQGSQRSHQVNQVPLFMKPTHQHGFRQLTPAPQGSSRQSTPQRF